MSEFFNETQQQGALREGIETLVQRDERTFTFVQYTRMQLSQDGYVFWIRGTQQLTVTGALHIATERDQEIDNTIAVNSVILTAESAVNEFNKVNPSTMWICQMQMPDGAVVPVAFARRGPFFSEAGIYHYAGFAVFPPFGPLLVNSAADIPAEPIVSNSMPIWLAQNAMAPVYPAFLVPENIQPPYVAVYINPELTTAIQPVPLLVRTSGTGLQSTTLYQLYRDTVQLIFYGFTNAMAQQFYATLVDASLTDETFGFSGEVPSIRDELRTQPEISALAMKKTLTFGASYYQSAADTVARRLILSALISNTIS